MFNPTSLSFVAIQHVLKEQSSNLFKNSDIQPVTDDTWNNKVKTSVASDFTSNKNYNKNVQV